MLVFYRSKLPLNVSLFKIHPQRNLDAKGLFPPGRVVPSNCTGQEEMTKSSRSFSPSTTIKLVLDTFLCFLLLRAQPWTSGHTSKGNASSDVLWNMKHKHICADYSPFNPNCGNLINNQALLWKTLTWSVASDDLQNVSTCPAPLYYGLSEINAPSVPTQYRIHFKNKHILLDFRS